MPKKIKAIVNCRTSEGGALEYKIRWRSSTSADDSWLVSATVPSSSTPATEGSVSTEGEGAKIEEVAAEAHRVE